MEVFNFLETFFLSEALENVGFLDFLLTDRNRTLQCVDYVQQLAFGGIAQNGGFCGSNVRVDGPLADGRSLALLAYHSG